jgi:hypothetical protein
MGNGKFLEKEILKATVVCDTQKEAIEKGKEIAKNQESELLIHGKNGEIREKIYMEITLKIYPDKKKTP